MNELHDSLRLLVLNKEGCPFRTAFFYIKQMNRCYVLHFMLTAEYVPAL